MKTFLLGPTDKGINCDCGLPWVRENRTVVGGPVRLLPDSDGWFLCSGCGQTRFTWPDLVTRPDVKPEPDMP